jgi:hypothetical protein
MTQGAVVGIMDTYPLGSFRVQRVGFGAIQLPGPGVFGPPCDHDEEIAVLRSIDHAQPNERSTDLPSASV